MQRSVSLLFLVPVAALAACDYSGDQFFSHPTEVPGIIDLGDIVPADVTDFASAQAATKYGEIGATGTAEKGGMTFSFTGTGGTVCIWVDPETMFWNQAVGKLGSERTYAYPDNNSDDGDLDIYAGLSVYYSGSPGEEIGSFDLLYQDALGNKVPIDFNECQAVSTTNSSITNAHGGRGAPESCSLSATQPGVDYTVLLETWSTPLDDDRLGYGLLVANGNCRQLQQLTIGADECLVNGEGMDPKKLSAGGADANVDPVTRQLTAPWSEDLTFPDELTFEQSFCTAFVGGGAELFNFCTDEAETKNCRKDHCFCGDPANSPTSSLQ